MAASEVRTVSFSLFEVSTNIRHCGCPIVINDLCGSGGGPPRLESEGGPPLAWLSFSLFPAAVKRRHCLFSLGRCTVGGGGEDWCRSELRRRTGESFQFFFRSREISG